MTRAHHLERPRGYVDERAQHGGKAVVTVDVDEVVELSQHFTGRVALDRVRTDRVSKRRHDTGSSMPTTRDIAHGDEEMLPRRSGSRRTSRPRLRGLGHPRCTRRRFDTGERHLLRRKQRPLERLGDPAQLVVSLDGVGCLELGRHTSPYEPFRGQVPIAVRARPPMAIAEGTDDGSSPGGFVVRTVTMVTSEDPYATVVVALRTIDAGREVGLDQPRR